MLHSIDLHEAREIFISLVSSYAHLIEERERITKFDFLERLKENYDTTDQRNHTFYEAAEAFPFRALHRVNKNIHIIYQ